MLLHDPKDENDVRTLSEKNLEVWAPVHIAPERYRVSSLGNVMSKVRGQDWSPVKPTVMEAGYLTVGIYPIQGEKAVTQQVHSLVMKAFEGEAPSPEHTDIRHLNGMKSDNRLCNLKYGTRSENMLDVLVHRRQGMPSVEERLQNVEESKGAWYQGYTCDPYLIQVGLEFLKERKLTINDLSRMWNCTRDVASNIAGGETRVVAGYVPPQRQGKRTTAEKDKILALVAEGLNAEQINHRLGATLTAQDVYYYKTKVSKDLVSKASEKMSDDTVREILETAKTTGWGAPRLAKHFGKSTSTVSSILSGVSYTHISRA